MKIVVDFEPGTDAAPLRGRLRQIDMPFVDGALADITYRHPSVRFRINETQLVFEGKLEGEVITGTSRDGEFTATFRLMRTATKIPEPPFVSEEVRFDSAGTTLAGTLVSPSKKGRHPAIVLLHGSGAGPRQALRPLAEMFASRGVAAFVYDKRAVGDARVAELVDFNDLTKDASAAVEFLKRRGDDINAQQIGLWGGSQGAGLAAMVAAQTPNVAFIVAVSGGGVTYSELIVYQITNRLRAQKFSEDEIREALAAVGQLHEFVRTGDNPAAMQAALDKAHGKRWAALALPKRAPTAEERATWIQWRHLDSNPLEFWEKLTIPVLAIWGENDASVPVDVSAERIADALKRAGNRDVTIKIFPGANHGLFLPPGIRPDTGGKWDWPRIAPGYMDLVFNWLLERVDVVEEGKRPKG
jgi:dienelactone hydrolase